MTARTAYYLAEIARAQQAAERVMATLRTHRAMMRRLQIENAELRAENERLKRRK